MAPVPVITGLGLITPLGRSRQETWNALLAGRSIRTHARLDPADDSKHPRVTSLALHAAREATAHARWNTDQPTAIVVGTSKGPIEAWLTKRTALPWGHNDVKHPNPPPASTSNKPLTRTGSPAFGLASVADTLARELGIPNGPRLTISAACASGLHALIRGAMLIRGGEARRVLVVAAEASVHPLFLGSFRRLGVLPPEGVPCRPFDRDRRGFLMCEAAAAVCLEAAGESDSDSPRPIAAVERFAMAGDAAHLTAGDPTGRIMRRLLTYVIDDRPVDLIHAHGTGTEFNDPVELAAIDASLRAPDQERAIIYSHKGALGHSLGASGLVSVLLNCLSHMHSVVPGNINTPHPLNSERATISGEVAARTVLRSVICASGFGGPTATVTLVST
jgi:3-oxoacyl-[acyl-carrier-protein] synthase II